MPRVVSGYRRILVPVADNLECERTIDVVCRLAAQRHASVTAVAVIEVPLLLPLDAHMFEEEERARWLLDRAEVIGAAYGVSVSSRIVRARDAATAIVELAEAIGAELVAIGSPRKRRGSPHAAIFGSTVQDVLKKAPCRVMVVASPPPP